MQDSNSVGRARVKAVVENESGSSFTVLEYSRLTFRANESE